MAYQKIAYIPPHRLGDALFTTPAIRYLKEQLPNCEITVMTPSSLAYEVYKGNPHINAIFDCSSKVDAKLREVDFDVIYGEIGNQRTLEIANNLKGHFYAAQGIRIPVTGKRSHKGAIASAGDTKRTPVHTTTRRAQDIQGFFQFRQACSNFTYCRPTTAEAEAYATATLNTFPIPQGATVIGLHIGCHNIQKMFSVGKQELNHKRAWKTKNAIAFFNALEAKDPNARGILTGTGGEARFNAKIAKACKNVIDLSNQLSIQQATALIAKLDAFISTDTGMLHLACSTPTPLLGLFAKPNPDPLINGPYPGRTRTAQIMEDSMDDISGDQVLQVLSELLESQQGTIQN